MQSTQYSLRRRASRCISRINSWVRSPLRNLTATVVPWCLCSRVRHMSGVRGWSYITRGGKSRHRSRLHIPGRFDTNPATPFSTRSCARVQSTSIQTAQQFKPQTLTHIRPVPLVLDCNTRTGDRPTLLARRAQSRLTQSSAVPSTRPCRYHRENRRRFDRRAPPG